MFPNSTKIKYSVGLVSLANIGAPWTSLAFGPLYAFCLGVCLYFYVAALFVRLLQSNDFRGVIKNAFPFLAGLLSIVMAHQSLVFVSIMLLGPYFVTKLANLSTNIKKRFILALLGIIVIVTVWTACFNSSIFAGVLFFYHEALYPISIAISNTIRMNLCTTMTPQIAVAILCALGCYSILRERANRWLIVSLAIAGITYALNVGTELPIKHFLSGFWYNDHYRTAAVYALSSIPLTCYGFAALLEKLFPPSKSTSAITSIIFSHLSEAAPSVFLCLICAFAIYGPSYTASNDLTVESTFSSYRKTISSRFSLGPDAKCLTKDELLFMRQVEGIVGDSTVLNYPFDGSCFAYGICNLNVVNHKWWGYDEDEDDVRYTRLHIGEIGSNEKELTLLKKLGIKYILLLDSPLAENATLMKLNYLPDEWAEFESITDNTPGLEIVLAEDDMRLYEITG